MLGRWYVRLVSMPNYFDFAVKVRDELDRILAESRPEIDEAKRQGDPEAWVKHFFIRMMWDRFEKAKAELQDSGKFEEYEQNFGKGPFYMSPVESKYYADYTRLPRILESMRGTETYLIGGFDIGFDRFPDQLQELLAKAEFRHDFEKFFSPKDTAFKRALDMVYALREASVGKLVGVFPKLMGTRQERKKGREPNLSKVFSESFSPQLDKIITLDTHNEAIQGYYGPGQIECMYTSSIMVVPLLEMIIDKVLSFDAGGGPRAVHMGKLVKKPVGIGTKTRDYTKPNNVDEVMLPGIKKGDNVLYVEDIIDRGSTVVRGVRKGFSLGAGSSTVAFPHALFNPPALDMLQELRDEYGERFRVITMDTVPHTNLPGWIEVLSVAPLLANVILNEFLSASLTGLYEYLPDNPRERT